MIHEKRREKMDRYLRWVFATINRYYYPVALSHAFSFELRRIFVIGCSQRRRVSKHRLNLLQFVLMENGCGDGDECKTSYLLE